MWEERERLEWQEQERGPGNSGTREATATKAGKTGTSGTGEAGASRARETGANRAGEANGPGSFEPS